MMFQSLFEAFEHFQLGQDSIGQLYTQMVARLNKVGKIYMNDSQAKQIMKVLNIDGSKAKQGMTAIHTDKSWT